MRITATVNGETRQADDVWEGESLLYVLRERMGLPGSKNAWEQGECGSCTVYLDGEAVCACLVAAGQAQGRSIVTVEGLAGLAGQSGLGGLAPEAGALHPVQQAFIEAGAVQCGFCTPGLIVATPDLLGRSAGVPADAGNRGGRGVGRLLTAGPDRRDPGPAAPQRGRARRRGHPRGAGRQPVPVHGLREDPGCGAAGAGPARAPRGD